MPATTTCDGNTPVLVLATLSRATEIEMTLSMLRHPRWSRQVQSGVAVADVANVNAWHSVYDCRML
jgi:hypothetical protein